MSRGWLRWLVLGALGSLVLSGTAAIALLGWVWASMPMLDGAVRAPGLDAEVGIERDASGRVTITAASQGDIAFGIGFAHGQDRFFQMDLLRRSGAGTLAALIGSSGLPMDRGARRHDLAGTARGALQQATPAHRAVLESYARGVNSGLASLGARPWEYIALRQSPSPWRPVDTYAVVLAMFRDLQDEANAREHVMDLAARALRPEVLELLTATPGPWEAPVEGEIGRSPEVRIPRAGPGREARRAAEGSRPAAALPASDPSGVGSNAFAVAGTLTRSGRAILANDMHLHLAVPTTWYPLRLIRIGEAPLDAVGVSLPGAPALVVGSNGHIAWGLTNSYGDWLDFVTIETDPLDGGRYRTPDGWRAFEQRREPIEVAGSVPEQLEIEQTIWGPVVGHDAQGRPVALHWTAQSPEALSLRLLDLVELGTVGDALALAPSIGVPAQNLLVAGADGSIGWTVMGRIPRRLGFSGQTPMSWASGRRRWHGWLSGDEVPRIAPGEQDRLWTANARVVSLAEQRLLGDGGYDFGARAHRIRDLLKQMPRFDEEALFDVQLDTHAEVMEPWRQRLLRLLERTPDLPNRERVRALLADWSGHAAAQSSAYRLVHDWRASLTRSLVTALGSAVPGLSHPFELAAVGRTEVIVSAILDAEPEWVPSGYADWQSFERSSLEQVLSAWGPSAEWPARTWGERNTTAIAHPLSAALPTWLRARLDMPTRELPGDSIVPRVAAPAFGASQRLVVAPGAEDAGILQVPGGPSAHPFSAMRLGDYDAWVEGRPVPLLPGPGAHWLRLIPAEG